MFGAYRMPNLVLEQACQASKIEPGRRSDGDHDHATFTTPPSRSDVGAPPRPRRSRDHDDMAFSTNAHEREPPGEERPEVPGVVA